MSQNSDTPRTNAELLIFKGFLKERYVPADFARQLERSLTACQAELERARKDAGRLDFLESVNKRFKMDWQLRFAPAGNASIKTVINLSGKVYPTLRAEIDAAIAAQKG